MGQEQFVVEGALVLCTMAQQPVGDWMGNVDNFKLYRVVNLGETNNGIFGLDEAFLNEGNVGPELNIEPFPVCKSPYYVQALSDIVGYLGELSQKTTVPEERELIEARRRFLMQSAQMAIEQKNGYWGDWRGVCVMELLDRWFNCSNTAHVDNFMELLEELKKELEEIFKELDQRIDQVLKDAKAAIGEEKLQKAWQMEWNGDFFPRKSQGTPSRLQGAAYGEKTERKELESIALWQPKEPSALREEEAWELLNDYREIEDRRTGWKALKFELRKKIPSINLRYAQEVVLNAEDKSEGIKGARYVDEEKDELKQEVEEVREQVRREADAVKGRGIQRIITKYGLSKSYQAYQDGISRLYGQIQELMNRASRINEDLTRKALVTTESFLMCRCGGRIHIINSGQWVENVDIKVEADIKTVLFFAEEHIYKLMVKCGEDAEEIEKRDGENNLIPTVPEGYTDQPVTEDYGSSRYSTIIALNGIHDILKSIGETGKHEGQIEDSEEIRRKYPLPNITIDLVPQNEVEAMENKKAMARAAADKLPLGMKWAFRVFFFLEDMANRFDNEKDNTFLRATGEIANNGKNDIINGLIEQGRKSGHKWIESMATTADTVKTISDDIGSMITWCQLLQNLMTKSYALFIGKVTIEINTGWDKYTFEANYDGDGNMIGEILYRKDYLGQDMFTNLGISHSYYDDTYQFDIYEGREPT